jgi:hypothetical protein
VILGLGSARLLTTYLVPLDLSEFVHPAPLFAEFDASPGAGTMASSMNPLVVRPGIQKFSSAPFDMLNVSGDQSHSVVECGCGY